MTVAENGIPNSMFIREVKPVARIAKHIHFSNASKKFFEIGGIP